MLPEIKVGLTYKMAANLIDRYAKNSHFGVQLENLATYYKIYEVKIISNVMNGIFGSTIFFYKSLSSRVRP